MRRNVPFLGEERITRSAEESDEAKKVSGREIDDVLSSLSAGSSWDDLVVEEKPAGKPRAGGSISKGDAVSKQVRHSAGHSPIGQTVKKPVDDKPSIDWIPFNNGHALRINLTGNFDQNIRSEWRRLLEETEGNGISQFEFNMTRTTNISLTGLGMLLMFKERKGSERGDIKLCNCNTDVWQILEWTGMDKYFTILGQPHSSPENKPKK
ncbi:MAG: anti-sigma factor antagonist [Moraxellaceae bacterium]|nr:MAG: anti-sigma factor antagonist [Moraxellaceae bacterium]